ESLRTLSQTYQRTGQNGPSSVRQPWTELSEGAFDSTALHRLQSPVRDSRKSIGSESSAVASSRLDGRQNVRGQVHSGPAKPVWLGLRRPLEDGVQHAEAPSSKTNRGSPHRELRS